MENILKKFLEDLKELRQAIKAEKVTQISKKTLRTKAEKLGSQWFDVSQSLTSTYGLPAELLEWYSIRCERLIKISAPNNPKKSYIDTLNDLIKQFRDDLILPIQKHSPLSKSGAKFDSFFDGISDTKESDYLQEAIGCAKANFYRAAIVLGWSATVNRMHRMIEEIGFTKFNVTSAHMASQTKGRYKRFNKSQNINNISELREVPDTTLLWIIEGIGLIDINQHTRLRSCFDMRCHSAHPGEAPITEYNLMSFFSDIDKIVLGNPTFELLEKE